MSGDRPDMHEASRMLADRIEDLALTLIGEQPSTKDRRAWRWGSRGSLAVEIAGSKRGQFFDHEAGTGGDTIDLICRFRRCSRKDAWSWALDWLGEAPEPPPAAPARRAPQKPASGLWQAVWREGRDAAASPVERYLVSRGLALAHDAPLRFHPACPRGEERRPAMLALMTDPVTAEPCGLHRTFLRPGGDGKAELTPNKMMMGAAGVIRLCPDDEVTGGLGIAEGIETGLSIIQHTGWRPVWAACSAGAIARLPVLDGIGGLTIFADNDPVNPVTGKRAGPEAAEACAARWYAAGCEVTIQQPPIGTDWADVLGRAA